MQLLLKIAALVIAAISAPVFADQLVRESDPEYKSVQEQMCAETACQRNLRVTLRQKDGELFDKTFDVFSPIVQEIGITVVAGQTVYVEADIEKNRLVNLRAVDTIVAPEKTLTAKFEQSTDGGMMLRVTSPFEETIKFDMGIMPLDKDDLYKTSSCPINKGIFEMWPEPIFLVVLGNGRVIDSKDMVCQ